MAARWHPRAGRTNGLATGIAVAIRWRAVTVVDSRDRARSRRFRALRRPAWVGGIEWHLYLTVDDGATWADQGSIGSDYYATITFASPDVAFAQSGPLFERTTDAGRTWEPMVLPPHAGSVASFSFLTPTNGYLLMSASGNGPGTLLSSSDAGLTWSVVAEVSPTVVGGIRFIDAQDGWAVGTREPFPPTGRPTLDALFETRDGGHSWQETTLPVPAGYQAADLQGVSGLPSPAGDGAYVLSAEYLDTARLAWVTEYLVTPDRGATWQVHGRLPGQDNGPLMPFDAQNWLAFLATQDGSAETFYTTGDAGGTWSPMSPAGLPPGFSVGYALRFADRQHGWAIVDGHNGDVGGYLNLSQQLYGTSDGGQTWHLLFGSQSASPSSSPTMAPPPRRSIRPAPSPAAGCGRSTGSTLLLSTDAGSSWRRTTVPTSTGFIPTAFSPSVFVLDQQHAWSLTIGPGSTANTGSSTDVLNRHRQSHVGWRADMAGQRGPCESRKHKSGRCLRGPAARLPRRFRAASERRHEHRRQHGRRRGHLVRGRDPAMARRDGHGQRCLDDLGGWAAGGGRTVPAADPRRQSRWRAHVAGRPPAGPRG